MVEAWRKYRAAKRRQRQDRVLGALALSARRGTPELAGWPLMQATGLGSGQLYPVLEELLQAGEITRRWADEQHPRRRFYRLVAEEG